MNFFIKGMTVVLLLWSVPALSQSSTDVRRLTLPECIDIAIANNISVRQSELSVRQNQVALEQSKADLLPSVIGNTNFSYNVGRTINQFTNEYVNQPVRQQNMSITADVVLFNSFRKLNTIKRNRRDLASSEYGLAAQKNDITLDVLQAYTQILLNQELLRNAEFTNRTTQSQLERTQRLVDAGSLPIANVLQLEAQQATDELTIINAENNLELALLNLKQILQIPESEPIEIANLDGEVPELVSLPESADDIYNQAVSTLPQINQATEDIAARRYDISIAKADFFPRITASAGIFSQYSSIAPDSIPRSGTDNVLRVLPTGDFLLVPDGLPGLPVGSRVPVFTEIEFPSELTNNTYVNQLDFNYRRFAQISLNIPIFNNWRTRTNVANAQIGLENARLNELNQRNLLRQTIEQVFLDVRSNAKQYQAAERRVAQLLRAFEDTERRYQAQAVDIYAYNQAQNNLTAAEADVLQAKYNYLLSLKVMDFYQGKPLSF
ncbi:MAG: TolC family protein [Cyclobacteriaceae bacterium]